KFSCSRATWMGGRAPSGHRGSGDLSTAEGGALVDEAPPVRRVGGTLPVSGVLSTGPALRAVDLPPPRVPGRPPTPPTRDELSVLDRRFHRCRTVAGAPWSGCLTTTTDVRS